MPSIIVLTNSFPFPPGEQFLEDEILYWGDTEFESITVFPARAVGTPRPVPSNVMVDLSLTRASAVTRAGFLVNALFSRVYWRELGYLLTSRKLRPYTVVRGLVHTARTLQRASQLTHAISARGGVVDIAYCYWNDLSAYAVIIVKARGLIGKVVSRAHGGDLYEERMRYNHAPLKRQFIRSFDRLFALSSEGKTYLENRYDVSSGAIEVRALGVPVPDQVSAPSPNGELHLVSVSFCTPVKRIDKIIDAVALLGEHESTLHICWTHIGGGPLVNELMKQAAEAFRGKDNIQWDFHGNLGNAEVKNFYISRPVDVFINVSESEGIPVSIMEAMACGVPAIAPDVGGVSHLVNSECGHLMSSNPPTKEIAAAIRSLGSASKNLDLRKKARRHVQENYNAATNYQKFASVCLNISRDEALDSIVDYSLRCRG